MIGDFGLVSLIKRIGGRRVEVADGPEPGSLRITVDGETEVETTTQLLELAQHVEVRKTIRDVVEPLWPGGDRRAALRARPDGHGARSST